MSLQETEVGMQTANIQDLVGKRVEILYGCGKESFRAKGQIVNVHGGWLLLKKEVAIWDTKKDKYVLHEYIEILIRLDKISQIEKTKVQKMPEIEDPA